MGPKVLQPQGFATQRRVPIASGGPQLQKLNIPCGFFVGIGGIETMGIYCAVWFPHQDQRCYCHGSSGTAWSFIGRGDYSHGNELPSVVAPLGQEVPELCELTTPCGFPIGTRHWEQTSTYPVGTWWIHCGSWIKVPSTCPPGTF